MLGKREMGNGNQEGVVPDHLRRQLAVAVRSVQWSYAIFWSLSTKQPGVLEWRDGYYNGDIKTRKMVHEMELKQDNMGLQRSKQLRELYECLLEGESDQIAKKPAALSPDDLSDAEWYYLVCMSFVFNQGQGLPGKARTSGQAIWLCNAHTADSKIFSRSLLAKSAAIQTVMCFPYLSGVIELGVTDLVPEDPSLIQHIKASLLEFSKPVCSEKSPYVPQKRDDDSDLVYAKVDREKADTIVLENFCSATENIGFDQKGADEREGNLQDEFTIGSPDDCSHGCQHKSQTDDSLLCEGINGNASQVQSWHLMEEDFSNCIQDSMNSSDCISQVLMNQEKDVHLLKPENLNITSLKDLQICNHAKFSSLDLGNDEDLHYQKTLIAILTRNSHRLLDTLYSRNNICKSSFMKWTRAKVVDGLKNPVVSQQMLKKILFSVPLMHSFGLVNLQLGYGKDDQLVKLEKVGTRLEYAYPDKKIENEKFFLLSSMIPSVSKADKASILGDTIEYLKELEARVEELESCIDLAEQEEGAGIKCPDLIHTTSENYENRSESSKRTWINKRKASQIDESSDPELSSVVPKSGPLLDMKVSMKEQEVLIEMKCPWREYLLLDIIDSMNNLNLDAHSVQSSTVDGILTATLQSKFRGEAVASARMIKQVLLTIAGKC